MLSPNPLQAECDPHLRFDLLHRIGRKPADLFFEKSLFDGSHLITFRPAILVQATISSSERNAHAEIRVLDACDGNNTHIECVPVEFVDREDHRRAWLI